MIDQKFACPFCNRSNARVQVFDDKDYQVSCHDCMARGPAAETEKTAVQLWEAFQLETSLQRLAIDESPDIIFIKDCDGRFLLGNPTLARHYGTTPDQLVGHDDGRFNSNREQVDSYLASIRDVIRSGETQRVEESSTNSLTGEVKHYLSVKKPFLGPSGDPRVLVIANDITELKSTYQQLEERENRYDYAMNIAGEGIWDWDLQHNVVTHNARWCQILGLDNTCLQHPVEEFVELLHEDDRHAVSAALDAVLSDTVGERKYIHEHRMRRENGEVFWVLDRGEVVERDDQGRPVRMVGAIRDIDERKQFELRLEEAKAELSRLNEQLEEAVKQRTAELYHSEERFALAMRGANEGLWDWDLETNQVYYSPRWKSMLGYEDSEVESLLDAWESMVHPGDKDYVLQAVQNYLSDKVDTFEVEMRMQHKSGHYVFIRSRAFKVIDSASGEAARLVGTHVDISDRKRSEIFDQRTTKILEMIAKGNAVSDIYNEIAHLYEGRHPGLRCSMLELEGDTLLHGGAPSLPQAYCDAVHGLKNGPDVGSCGTSTYTGQRVLVEDIETDPKWAKLKDYALPHGMRCCWSEPIQNSSGTVLGAFGMYYNHPALPSEEESNDLTSAARLAGIIMEREHNQRRIRDLAYSDTLTGLASRAYFYLNFNKHLKQSERNNTRFGLLYIDLDGFKSVNDTMGHDAGDLLLQETALRLREASRDTDLVARLGGDEFCIIVDDIADNYCPANVAERCLKLISQPITLNGREQFPSCSVGIALYPADGDNIESLIKAADTALYEAKKHGKNRYAFYDKEFTDKAEYRFKLEQDLKEAIEQQQLTVVYQPQVDIISGAIVGVEALSRWNHPQLGYIAPVEFIGIAEQIGMIKPLTEWVIQTVCDQVAAWERQGFSPIHAAVNISPSHFLDAELLPVIAQALKTTGISPVNLELEVTEGVVQTNIKNLSAFHGLQELGVSLAIDDFGSGYSSFSSLKHMNVNVLKIDKHFIDEVVTDQKSQLLVSSMIDMGHSLGYKIVAEGIEKPEQQEQLKSLNCDIGQGYLFSKPLPADEMTQLLKKNQSRASANDV